jgi:hypothetical protein
MRIAGTAICRPFELQLLNVVHVDQCVEKFCAG